jgi:hypothetical protein
MKAFTRYIFDTGFFLQITNGLSKLKAVEHGFFL